MSKLPHYHQLMHPLASPDRGPSSYRERPSFVYKIQSLPSFTINPSLFSYGCLNVLIVLKMSLNRSEVEASNNLKQRGPTTGPRAACGPPRCFQLPAEAFR